MIVRPAQKSDLNEIARLHVNSIETGFLSQLGVKFLIELYDSISRQPGSCLFTVEIGGQIKGFLAGTVDTRGLYKKLLIKNWHRFIFPLSGFLFNPEALFHIIETVLYGFNDKKNIDTTNTSAELLSISVDESERGKGLGKKLISEFESFLKNSSISTYKVVTFSENQTSNKFYQSCKFNFNRQFIHHRNIMNEYIKSV